MTRISNLLGKQRKSQADLCFFLGVSPSVYSEWKSGKSKSFYQYVNRIAEYLECTSDYLYGNDAAFSSAEIILMNDYRSLSSEAQEHIRFSIEMAKAYEKEDTVLVFQVSREGQAPGYIEMTRKEADRLLSLHNEAEE